VAIHDVQLIDDQFCLVLQYCDGPNLAQWLKEQGPVEGAARSGSSVAGR